MSFRKASVLFFLPLALGAQPNETSQIRIFDSVSKKEISQEILESKVRDADAVLIGEEHDDTAGHVWQLETLKRLSEKFPFALSLEMLERDQQRILNEFLRGELTEKGYLNGTVFWPNYLSDYHPLVEYAKSKKLPVIASNVPRRYANLVSQKGLSSLFRLRSPFLPPRYLIGLHRQEQYESKLKAVLGHHGSTANLGNFMDAQYLWDASMADAIADAFYATGRKIFHINGRFHSDQGMGVPFRLRQMGLKVLVISVFPVNQSFGPGEEDFLQAEVLVLTPRKVVP